MLREGEKARTHPYTAVSAAGHEVDVVELQRGHGAGMAYQAAVQSIAGKDDTVLTQDFTVASDGTIHLLVRHTVHTIVFGRVGPLKHLTVTTESGDANSVN